MSTHVIPSRLDYSYVVSYILMRIALNTLEPGNVSKWTIYY